MGFFLLFRFVRWLLWAQQNTAVSLLLQTIGFYIRIVFALSLSISLFLVDLTFNWKHPTIQKPNFVRMSVLFDFPRERLCVFVWMSREINRTLNWIQKFLFDIFHNNCCSRTLYTKHKQICILNRSKLNFGFLLGLQVF